MGVKDSIQKEIDFLDRKARFYQSLLLALIGGVVWTIFSFVEKKVDIFAIYFDIIGVIIVIGLYKYITKIDKEQLKLIKKLKKEK